MTRKINKFENWKWSLKVSHSYRRKYEIKSNGKLDIFGFQSNLTIMSLPPKDWSVDFSVPISGSFTFPNKTNWILYLNHVFWRFSSKLNHYQSWFLILLLSILKPLQNWWAKNEKMRAIWCSVYTVQSTAFGRVHHFFLVC